ncbi:DUF4350 domain-containing protein [Microbispora corallina]|uniref:DUF4350 domain-containing protein n=1 Tax=Microbispora corallina TaxID=83302 RepID=A0ABQ4G922_9ACTN|nr:DUF4350 domain-containing protein [Microbispora corallina]GIH43591.1 hypothetical protein Mco01_65910 [Microbispora corallina]
MTVTVAGSPAPVSPTAGALWRRGRAVLLVAVLVLVAALVPALLAPSEESGRYLDPGDTSLSGSGALSALLTAHGVSVSRADGVAGALAQAGPDTLLLVTEASALTRDEASRIGAAPGDRLVVGQVPYLDVLASGVTARREPARPRSREPGCALREAVRAGSAHMGGTAFTGPPGSTGCYPDDGRPTLVRYATGGRTVTVVGDGAFLTNRRLAEDGNAALAVNLAGARPRLIWLVPPDADDADGMGDDDSGDGGSGGGRGLGDLIPDGVGWAVVQLVAAVGVVALWRGRRLGPVVAERLPVVVRAAETVEGRGRLYRARRARDRAALALRAAAADRLTAPLGLPRTATFDEIAAAVAVRTGEDPERVRSALYGPPPADDAALVALAGHLDTLERQVRES